MPLPQIITQAAFGSFPGDASYTWKTVGDTAAQANSYVRGLAWQRGVDSIIGRTATGTGVVTIRDLTYAGAKRAWDSRNTASPFYPNVRRGLPFRATATISGSTFNLFQHFMDGDPRQRIGPNYTEYGFTTVDGFARLALAAPSPDNASLTIDPSGSNNTLVFTARNPGMNEENISIQYYGAPHPLQVYVHHTDIKVRLHIPGLGGNPGNSASAVAAAIAANGSANALVTVANGVGSDGSGIISDEVPPTFLSGADAAAFPQELSGARISRCLDQAGWPAALRDIDTGTVTIVASSFATNEQGRLLSHVLDVAGEPGEFGLVFVSGDGKCTFLDRNALYSNPNQAVFAATFSDSPNDGFVTYASAQPRSSSEINEWVGTRDGGMTMIVQDKTSIAQSIGRVSHQVESLLTNDSALRAELEFGRDEYGHPVQVFESITVKPGNDTLAWTKCLGIEVGSRIRVRENPPGGGTPNVSTYLVTNLSGQIPDDVADSTFTFGLWPIRITNYFVFDDATYGNLDTTVLAYN